MKILKMFINTLPKEIWLALSAMERRFWDWEILAPIAGKPVMEGKGVLFKIFADIDVFDIEINETDPEKFVEIVKALEPTFGGINLEDIKAPECFYIEKKLKERLKIPVMHDDQHGTAIISSAALLNALGNSKEKNR